MMRSLFTITAFTGLICSALGQAPQGSADPSGCFQTVALERAMLAVPTHPFDIATQLSNAQLDSLDACSRIGYALHHPLILMPGSSVGGPDLPDNIYSSLTPVRVGLQPNSDQLEAILDRRDSSITCIRSCIQESDATSLDLKRIIVALRAHELVPSIIAAFVKGGRKDLEWLSVLVSFMRADSYAPFINVGVGERLIGGPDSRDRTSVPATPKNIQEILDMAAQYDASRWKR